MKALSPAEKTMRGFPCSVCGAWPWEPCRSKGGKDLRNSHSARFYAATDAGALPVGKL